MKRTPLRPGEPPVRKTRLRSSRTPIRARRKDPKRRRFAGRRCKPFREWVAEQRCVLRDSFGHYCLGTVQCCHVKSRGAGGSDVGNCFPGCAVAHTRQHDMGIDSFQHYYDVDLPLIAARLAQSWLSLHGESWLATPAGIEFLATHPELAEGRTE